MFDLCVWLLGLFFKASEIALLCSGDLGFIDYFHVEGFCLVIYLSTKTVTKNGPQS